jgi:hypothetical protein
MALDPYKTGTHSYQNYSMQTTLMKQKKATGAVRGGFF